MGDAEKDDLQLLLEDIRKTIADNGRFLSMLRNDGNTLEDEIAEEVENPEDNFEEL